MSCVLLQPFDVWKTQRQLVGPGFQGMRTLFRQAGIAPLYAGAGAAAARVCVGALVQFPLLAWLLQALPDGPGYAAVAGSTARAAAAIITTPLLVVKTHVERHPGRQTQAIREVLPALAKAGPRSMFAAAAPTLLRDAPYSGLFLAFYTELMPITARAGEVLQTPVAAAAAGASACAVTQPADVVRAHMQAAAAQAAWAQRQPVSHAILESAQRTWAKQGLLGFWSGLLPRLLKRSVSASLTWTLVEWGVKAQRRQQGRHT